MRIINALNPFNILQGGGAVVAATDPYAVPDAIITMASTSGDQLIPTFTNIPFDGLYIQLQLAADSGFTTALGSEGAIRDETEFVDMDFRAADMPFSILTAQPLQTVYLRCRYGTDNDSGGITWTDWSNTISDTVTNFGVAELWQGSTGINKYSAINVPSALSYEMTTHVGQYGWVRTTTPCEGKIQYEVTQDGIGNDASARMVFGFVESTTDLSVANWTPGFSSSPAGCYLAINKGATQGFFIRSNSSETINLGGTATDGDIYSVRLDTATDEIKIYRNSVLILTRTLTANTPTVWTACFACRSGSVANPSGGTANFAGPFSLALSDSFLPYGASS